MSVDIEVLRSRDAPATPLVNNRGTVDEFVSFIYRLGQLVETVVADVAEAAPPLSLVRNCDSEPTCVSAGKTSRALATTLFPTCAVEAPG